MDRWYSRNSLVKIARYSLAIFFIFATVLYAFTWKVLAYDPLTVPKDGYDLFITSGTSLKQFTKQLYSNGLLSHPKFLRLYLLYKGNTKQIKTGEYNIKPGTTALQLLDKVFKGEVTQYAFTIVEGWQTAQMIEALQQHPKIKSLLVGLSKQEIIHKLDLPINHLEGMFLPDTYHFAAYTTDIDFLRRAYFSMMQKLADAWKQRDPHTTLQNPYQALILASIIEKETSLKSEYGEIAGVFTRRLAKKMKLQADPTVIYGLQNKLNGPLLRKHLKIDTPYNTYRHVGLPPTPIALPSASALNAALHPTPGKSLYFVATGEGDGAHIFSATLAEHNKAVNKLYKSRN